MEKFSLYEILSFFLPGFVVIEVVLLYQKYVFGYESLLFNPDSKIGDSLIFICLSLFAGIIIHIFTFWLLGSKKENYFKRKIMPSVREITTKSKSIQITLPILFDEYKLLNKDNTELTKEKDDVDNLFHFAYFYLETNNKISAAKNFQSLYFWFRNMFIISCFLTPISILMFAIAFTKNYACYRIDSAIIIMIANIIMLIIVSPAARWLRVKFIEKIFWSFYIEMIFKNENNNKQ